MSLTLGFGVDPGVFFQNRRDSDVFDIFVVLNDDVTVSDHERVKLEVLGLSVPVVLVPYAANASFKQVGYSDIVKPIKRRYRPGMANQ